MTLTQRQQRELDYHKGHAAKRAGVLDEPLKYDICEGTRWWNNGWAMFGALQRIGMDGQKVLVVGCGVGTDAIRIAKMGADVYAFDLSPESLGIARKLAARERMPVRFDEMTAESLTYPDNLFDVIVARDILHHVDIPQTMAELSRVAKPRAILLLNEIYSHSWTEKIRRSRFVKRYVYPAIQKVIYKGRLVYITQDERKLTEVDTDLIEREVTVLRRTYFNLFVMRLIPDMYKRVSQADQVLLATLGGLGRYLAGRIMIEGEFK